MRWSLAGCLALCLLSAAAPLSGQAPDESTLRRNYEEKLKKPFATKITWETTLEKAKERARAEGKPILGYFTRSFAP
jgi:hypothetical protein